MAERAIIAYAVAERTQRRTVVQRDRRALTDVLFKIALSARRTNNRVEDALSLSSGQTSDPGPVSRSTTARLWSDHLRLSGYGHREIG
jgi:hypothetical protein